MANQELQSLHTRLTGEVKKLDADIAALTTQRASKLEAIEAIKAHALPAPAATPAPAKTPDSK